MEPYIHSTNSSFQTQGLSYFFYCFQTLLFRVPLQNKGPHFIHVESASKVRFYGPLDWAGCGVVRSQEQLHQILLLLVEHRASMKSFQALRSPAIPLTSFHDLLVLLISSSIVLRHVLFGLPLLLYPWGFQSNAVFWIAPVSLCNVCPIQFHFLLFIRFSIDFWRVILHSSSFVILLVHLIFIILLKYLFTNICSTWTA